MRNYNISTINLKSSEDTIKQLTAECVELKKRDERNRDQIELMLDEQGKYELIFLVLNLFF